MVLLIRKIPGRPPGTQLVKICNLIYLTPHHGNCKSGNNSAKLIFGVFFQTKRDLYMSCTMLCISAMDDINIFYVFYI